MRSRSTKGFSAVAMAIASLLGPPGLESEIVDRVVAIVGTEAVTLSEIDIEIRLEALLNNSDFVGIGDRGENVLRRLIDRRLILQDLLLTPFLIVQEDEVEQQIEMLRAQRFLGGRDFEAALLHYRLTEADCRSFLDEQISFERYVSFRFKTGLDAGQPAIEAYYRDEYSRQQRALGEAVAPLAAVSAAIAEVIVERQANELLEERLNELRSLNRIESRLRPGGRASP